MQKGAKGVDSSALMIIHIYQLLNPFSSQKGAYETGELKECWWKGWETVRDMFE
jgi:hypothetical protein